MTVRFRAIVRGEGLVRDVAESFQFPGGEHHLRNILDNRDPKTVWIADVRGADPADLLKAALLANVAHARQAPFVLFIPYFPGARADKNWGNEPVTAVVYAELIRAMNPQQTICIDLHSTLVSRYFDPPLPKKLRLTMLDALPLLEVAVGDATRFDAVIAPDEGALKRAGNVAEKLGIDCYHAVKHRDQATGDILSYAMADKPPATGRYLVVDDICDGGRTFNELAKITELPRERLELWVTHGIFSGAAVQLRQHYERIHTSDSHPGHNQMGVLNEGADNAVKIGVASTHVPCETYMIENLHEDLRLPPILGPVMAK